MNTKVVGLDYVNDILESGKYLGGGCSREAYEVNDLVYKIPGGIINWARGEFDDYDIGENGPVYYERCKSQPEEEADIWVAVNGTAYEKYFTPILETIYVLECSAPIIVMPKEIPLDYFFPEYEDYFDSVLGGAPFMKAVEDITNDSRAMEFCNVLVDELGIDDLHEGNITYDPSSEFPFRIFDYGDGDSGRVSRIVA